MTLEFDRTDQYDRMLAGPRTADGTLVNASIARAGFAESVTYAPHDRFTAVVDAAGDEARAAGRGLWSGGCG